MPAAVSFNGQTGRRVRAPKTAEFIASHIRGRIVRGELKTGEALPPEAKLMEIFGVSRPTLREAFRILETEALIRIRRGPGGGARVISPDNAVAARHAGLLLQVSSTTIADVCDARTMIESAAVGMLATRRTRQDLADLNSCIDDMAALVDGFGESADADACSSATQRFHDLILDRAGNHTFVVLAGILQEVVAAHLSVAVHRTFGDPATQDGLRKMVRSCRKLVHLVEEKDAEGAERHWATHSKIMFRRLLSDDPGAKAVVDLFD